MPLEAAAISNFFCANKAKLHVSNSASLSSSSTLAFRKSVLRHSTWERLTNDLPSLTKPVKNVLVITGSTEFHIQKIGTAGLTGAGKSSLVAALMKFAFTEGDIFVDGLNIKEMYVVPDTSRQYINTITFALCPAKFV